MTILQYSGFIAVTVAALLIILRACYFLFVVKTDPLYAVLPSLARWYMNRQQQKGVKHNVDLNS